MHFYGKVTVLRIEVDGLVMKPLLSLHALYQAIISQLKPTLFVMGELGLKAGGGGRNLIFMFASC